MQLDDSLEADHDDAVFGNFLFKCPLYADLSKADFLDPDEESDFDFDIAHPEHEPKHPPPPPEPLYVPSPDRARAALGDERGGLEGNGGEIYEAKGGGNRAGPGAGLGAKGGKTGVGKSVFRSAPVASAPIVAASIAAGPASKREVRTAVPVNKTKVKMDPETEKMLKEFNEAQKKKKERKELDLFDDDTLAVLEAFNNEVAEASKSQSDRIGVTTRSGRRGGVGGGGGAVVNTAPAAQHPAKTVITPPSATSAVSRSKPIQITPPENKNTTTGASSNPHVPRQPLLPKAAGVRPQQQQQQASAIPASGAKKASAVVSTKGTKRPQEDEMDPEILAMLSAHNKKFKKEPTYVPQKHSVAEIKVWETETGKTWHSLSGSEREAVNEELAFRKARGVVLRV
jgi:hypothetical protein